MITNEKLTRPAIIRVLLSILNSRWLNSTPCKYGFIGNVDAFDIDNLRSEIVQRPALTVAQLVREAEDFKSCPIRKSGVTVIQNGQQQEATIWDLLELRDLGSK